VTDTDDETPETDGRDPGKLLRDMVEHVLATAATWPAWDGRPVSADDRVYTPHKVIRRTADHMIDHLAEVEARLAGASPLPDQWHASAVTTTADLAPFTAEDLDEASSRLRRLAQIWSLRLDGLSAENLDAARDGWTVRQIAFHLAESSYYADAMGSVIR
jgi:hypothetical protein